MIPVTPEVFLIAETGPSVAGDRLEPDMREALENYLAAVDLDHPDAETKASAWETDAQSDAEALIEAAGRMCYRSWAPGLNRNVSKVRQGNAAYIDNVLSAHHGSVLEHASATFIFHHCSRIFTHELVRHRAGCAISQESMRYVALDNIPLWLPPETLGLIEQIVRDHEGAPKHFEGNVVPTSVEEDFHDIVLRIEAVQRRVHAALDATKPPMDVKKRLTSFLRRIAPDGIATGIVWTANFRTLRHVLALRTEKSAEEEIRLVFDQVGAIATQRWPAVFGDFVRTTDGTWAPKYAKV